MDNSLAPIVLFVYNRPDHTKRTLSALSKNALAKQSLLYVYCDGAKENATKKEVENVSKVRHLVRSRQWCKEVNIIERERNWGLADNIVDGVTTIVNKYGRVIVLEDDIVTSPGFLKYMNEALDLYDNEEHVMHISAYWFPVKRWKQLSETFFYNVTSCWGWGTWKRAWDKLELDPEYLKGEIEKDSGKIKNFTIDYSSDFIGQLNLNISGRKRTWAVKWYASMFLNNGFALHPRQSLVNNIGHDGTGDNCGSSSKYLWPNLAREINVEKIRVKESLKARKEIRTFYSDKSSGVLSEIVKGLKKNLSPALKRYLKRKF